MGHKATDTIVQICSKYGIPAKISGAGGGGIVYGLLYPNINLEDLMQELKQNKFSVMMNVEIGGPGVEIMERDDTLTARS